MLRTSIDKIRKNGFVLTKKRSRRYSAKTITDADYTDDIAKDSCENKFLKEARLEKHKKFRCGMRPHE